MKKVYGVLFLVLLASFAFGSDAQTDQPKTKIKPALLVIDIQNEYLPYMSELGKKLAMEMINGAIWSFHEKGFPVIRVYHTDPRWGPEPGTEGFEYPKSVIIGADDPQIIKNYPNAFKKTELEKLLREKDCNTLFLCGLSATGCVLATYHGAMDLDYNVFLIRDALISPDSEQTKAVEGFCETVTYEAMRLILDNAPN